MVPVLTEVAASRERPPNLPQVTPLAWQSWDLNPSSQPSAATRFKCLEYASVWIYATVGREEVRGYSPGRTLWDSNSIPFIYKLENWNPQIISNHPEYVMQNKQSNYIVSSMGVSIHFLGLLLETQYRVYDHSPLSLLQIPNQASSNQHRSL